MNTRFLMTLAAGLLACGAASAQPAQAASGPGCGPMAGASAAPNADCPGGRGGMHGGPRSGSGYTPGWSMMTPAERQQHQDKLRTLKTYDECHDYMGQHHEQMAARAKEKGQALPTKPRHDACAGLPAAKK